MKDQFELIIDKDGTIESVYQDGLAEALDAEERQVCRASNVEWEEIGDRKGWTVRSAKNPQLAIRARENVFGLWVASDNEQWSVITFPTREEALAEEVKQFWELLGKPAKVSYHTNCTTTPCPECLQEHEIDRAIEEEHGGR